MNTHRSSKLPRVALIAGPTASGKSAIALALAERLNGTVINADASQVYADLRILSARPSAADEERAPHRLFGHVDGADVGYSAARWAAEARAAINDAMSDGRLPILVGGTGLYLRTLIDGIAPIPPIDAVIRAGIRAMPVEQAYLALQRYDPAAAASLNPADTTRIARALEVVRSTGRPIAEWRARREGGIGGAIDLVATILLPPRDWLDQRIRERSAAMADAGALDEVARLLSRPDMPRDVPVLRAIGVPEFTALLHGEIDRGSAIERLALATRQYAKRQYTWFRNQPPPAWERTRAIDLNEIATLIETRLLN